MNLAKSYIYFVWTAKFKNFLCSFIILGHPVGLILADQHFSPISVNIIFQPAYAARRGK